MMSIKLYFFPQEPNKPNLSNFCQKLETFLRATNFTNYTVHAVQPNFAPKGKLPYIDLTDDGETKKLADTHFIIRHLTENKVVPDLDANLTAVQRAESRAWQTWTEELMYQAVVYERWVPADNFAVTKAALPGRMSAIILAIFAWYFRRNITNALWSHGMARHTDEERVVLEKEYVEGLEARLEGTEYFHGSEPTTVDVVLYAFLAHAVVHPGNPVFKSLLLGSERLKRYTAVLTRKWFPEYKGVLELVDKAHSE